VLFLWGDVVFVEISAIFAAVLLLKQMSKCKPQNINDEKIILHYKNHNRIC